MYKLIALDMDGTLFTSDKKITDRTKKAIAAAHAQGVKIVLASGRPLDGLHKPLAELNLISDNEYVLCYNGALAVTAESGTILSQCTLTGADCKRLFALAQQIGVHCHAFSTKQGLITNETSEYTAYEARLNEMTYTIINPQTDIADDEIIIKVMFIDPPEILNEAVKKVPDWVYEDFNAFNSSPFFFEITNKAVDKGAGLAQLAQRLNIRQEEVIACGDESNDYSMIKYAGLGVAMGNAIDKVKAAANYITDTNDNDGVAKVIEKFILK